MLWLAPSARALCWFGPTRVCWSCPTVGLNEGTTGANCEHPDRPREGGWRTSSLRHDAVTGRGHEPLAPSQEVRGRHGQRRYLARSRSRAVRTGFRPAAVPAAPSRPRRQVRVRRGNGGGRPPRGARRHGTRALCCGHCDPLSGEELGRCVLDVFHGSYLLRRKRGNRPEGPDRTQQPVCRPHQRGSSYLRWGWVSRPPMRSMRSR